MAKRYVVRDALANIFPHYSTPISTSFDILNDLTCLSDFKSVAINTERRIFPTLN